MGKVMGVAEVAESDAPISDSDAASIEGGIRALVRRNRLAVAAELIDLPCEDALLAGAASIADIEKLMTELQTARDFLQSEAERVRRMNARYAHLAQTASASVKVCVGRSSVASGASLRILARSHPFCTNISVPSGRTSVIVTCTSVSCAVDFNQRSTLALPITAVSCVSGAVVYASAVPGLGAGQFHFGS